MSEPTAPDEEPVDRRRAVGSYLRIRPWEVVPPPGDERPSEFRATAAVDGHLRNVAGGLYTGALLAGADNIGGMAAGMSMLPKWVVTTNMLATVARPAQVGPLGLHARVLRRGKNAVVTVVDVVDDGDGGAPVAAVTMTCAVLDASHLDLQFPRPVVGEMPPVDPHPLSAEEFFGIEPGEGPVTRLQIRERVRNPWGIVHGGAAAMLADVGARRAVAARPGPAGAGGRPGTGGPEGLVAGDTVVHYLRPARAGPIEARCQVLGSYGDRSVVRVAIHDVGADDRLVELASVVVLQL